MYTFAIYSGVSCSMDTSIIIRVGSPIYVIPICAVSQEHALVSITHTSRKLREFSVGIKIDLVFVWVVEIDAILEWGIGVDLISVQG